MTNPRGVGTLQNFYKMGLTDKMMAEYEPSGECLSINDAPY